MLQSMAVPRNAALLPKRMADGLHQRRPVGGLYQRQKSTAAAAQKIISNSNVDGAGHDDDYDGDVEFPSIEELINRSRKNVEGPEKLSRKRETAAMSSQRPTNDSPQKRRCIQPKRQELIDLTGSSENCAICSNILKQGEDSASRAFFFKVICGECFFGNTSEELMVKPLTKQLWCPKYDHYKNLQQKVCELFTIDCSICLEEVDNKDRVVTPCGHSFCLECFDHFLRSLEDPVHLRCPKCREQLPRGKEELTSFQTVQRGEVSKLPLVNCKPKRNPRSPKQTIEQAEGRGNHADSLTPLKHLFSTKKNIVVISGAGISTNAGISDFCDKSGRNSSRHLFDASVYGQGGRYTEFHETLYELVASTSTATPTKFHKLLDHNSDRVTHLTQNIDCLEDKLPSLSRKTHRLHGRVDTLFCQLDGTHTFKVALEDFEQKVQSRCPKCIEANEERVANNKRSIRVGVLLPKILLYGTVKEDVIEKKLLNSMFAKADAVILAGTRLKCKSVKILAREICRAVKWNNGLTVWVNKQEPDSEFRSLLDYVWQGDCDEFAAACSVEGL